MAFKENRNIKYGIILSYVSMIIGVIGTLLVTNKVVNYIGDYNYGLYSFVNSITTWLTVISTSLNASFVRFATIEAKENNGDVSKINTIYMKFFIILSLFVLLIGVSIISCLYFGEIKLGEYSIEDSKIMYLLFFFSILNIALTMPTTLFTLYISYKKRFIFGKLLVCFTSIITYVGHFLIAYYTRNIILISIFTICITTITLIFSVFFAYKIIGFKFCKASFKENKTVVRSIIVFSSVIIFNSVVDQLNSSVDKTLLGIFSIPEDVTLYQLGQGFGTYLTIMSISVSSVYIPKINELVVHGDSESINELYLKISKIQIVILCLVAFGFLTSGKDFVIWWIGEKRIMAYYVAVTLMMISLCPLSLNSSIEIQRSLNKHKFRAYVYFIFALVNVGLSILFLYIFPDDKKIWACLIGSVIGRILSHWIAMNIYNYKVIKLPVVRYMLFLLKYILIGTFCFAVVYFISLGFVIDNPLFLFLIKGSSFVIVFFFMMLIFDRNYLFSLIKKIFRR